MARMMKRFSGVRMMLAAAMVAMAMLGGCGRSMVADPVPFGEAGAGDEAYWHALADRSAISNDEALHGLLLLLDGQDAAGDYAARVRTLQERGLLSANFDAPAEQTVRRGTVAQIVASALKVKGGLSMRLVGAHPRYATRELVFLGVMPASTPDQSLPGVEFLGIISRTEELLENPS